MHLKVVGVFSPCAQGSIKREHVISASKGYQLTVHAFKEVQTGLAQFSVHDK